MEEKANWELKKSFSYLVMGMELCGRARLASYLSIYLSFRGRPKPLGTHSHSRFNSNKIGFHDFLFLFSIWFFFLPHWSIHTHSHSVSLKRLLQPIYLLPLINEITPSNDKQSPSHSFFFSFYKQLPVTTSSHTHIYIYVPHSSPVNRFLFVQLLFAIFLLLGKVLISPFPNHLVVVFFSPSSSF